MLFQEMIALLVVYLIISIPVMLIIAKKMNSTCKPDVIELNGNEFGSAENEDKIAA